MKRDMASVLASLDPADAEERWAGEVLRRAIAAAGDKGALQFRQREGNDLRFILIGKGYPGLEMHPADVWGHNWYLTNPGLENAGERLTAAGFPEPRRRLGQKFYGPKDRPPTPEALAMRERRAARRAARDARLAAEAAGETEKEGSRMLETIHDYRPGGLTDSERKWMAEQLDKPRGVSKKDRAEYSKIMHLDYLAHQANDPLLTYLPTSPVHVSHSVSSPVVACGLDTKRRSVIGEIIRTPSEAAKVDCPHCRLEMGLSSLPSPRTDVPRPTYPVGIQSILDAARKEGPEDYARNRVLRDALLRNKGEELMVDGSHGSRSDAESALAALQSAGINVVLQEVDHPTRYGSSVFYFTAPDGGERLGTTGLASLVGGQTPPAAAPAPAPDPWAYSGPVNPGSVYNYEDDPDAQGFPVVHPGRLQSMREYMEWEHDPADGWIPPVAFHDRLMKVLDESRALRNTDPKTWDAERRRRYQFLLANEIVLKELLHDAMEDSRAFIKGPLLARPAAAAPPPQIALTDVNGDGKPDAIVTAPTLEEAVQVGNAALDGLEKRTGAAPGLFDLGELEPSSKRTLINEARYREKHGMLPKGKPVASNKVQVATSRARSRARRFNPGGSRR